MINLGLVGVGHWGPNLIKSFEAENRALISMICDKDSSRLERLRSVHKKQSSLLNIKTF